METKTIKVAEVTVQTNMIKIKDELGLTYSIFKTKKDGDPTQAFLTQQALGDLSGKWFEVGFDESPAPQGGKYRNIKIIKPAGEIDSTMPIQEIKKFIQAPEHKTPKAIDPYPPPKFEVVPDWDEINLRKTAEIRRCLAFKEARAHLSTMGVDIETHPERWDDLMHIGIGILNGELKQNETTKHG